MALATCEEEHKPSFSAVLKDQIKALRKQLDKSNLVKNLTTPSFDMAMPSFAPKRPARPNNERDIHALLDALSDSIGSSRIFTTKHDSQEPHIPNGGFRLLLDNLSESVAKGDMTAERAIRALRPPPANMSSRDVGRSARHQSMRVAQRIPDDLCTLGEHSIPEALSNVDRTYWNGVRLSQPSFDSVSTLENRNHPEFLSQGTQNV